MDCADWKKAAESIDALLKDHAKDPAAKQAIAKAYFLRAQCLVHVPDFIKATEDCNRALALAKETMDLSVEGETLRLMANIAWKKADYKSALEYLHTALDIALKLKDLRLEGVVHLEQGTTYSNMGELNTADREYREAVLCLEKAGDMHELARAYNNFANNFVFSKKFDKAAEMFAKTKKIAEKIGDQGRLAWGAFNRAECLIELGATKEALMELDIAMPILERIGDSFGATGANQMYGLAYGKTEDWAKAEEYLNKARQMAQRNNMVINEGKIIRDMGRVAKWRGDRTKAMQLFKEAEALFTKQGSKRELTRVQEEITDMQQGV
jgi:tetratricopeptide (TPR) repeat protein